MQMPIPPKIIQRAEVKNASSGRIQRVEHQKNTNTNFGKATEEQFALWVLRDRF